MILAVVILNISLDCFGAFLKVRMLLFKYQKKTNDSINIPHIANLQFFENRDTFNSRIPK